MQIINCINTNLLQLANAVHILSHEQYTEPVKVLSNTSIGQHVRHIIELLQCLHEVYLTGVVNYENRKRDKDIENNKSAALVCLKDMGRSLQKENKELVLHVNDPASSDLHLDIPTNYYRELLFNLEHIIHHMAIIRIGITESTTIELPQEFGIAPSTLKYKRECAQSRIYH